MAITNITALALALAIQTRGKKDSLSKYDIGHNNPFIQEALAKAEEEKQKAMGAALAKEILELNELTQKTVENNVAAIRAYRSGIMVAKKKLREIDRAVAYAKETNNYVPLAAVCGHYISSNEASLAKIPDDWKPKSK